MFIVLFGVSYMLALIEGEMVINFLIFIIELSSVAVMILAATKTLARHLGLLCVCMCVVLM